MLLAILTLICGTGGGRIQANSGDDEMAVTSKSSDASNSRNLEAMIVTTD
jgi:hypothetical protein